MLYWVMFTAMEASMSQVNLQDPKTAAQIYFGSIMKTIDTKDETFIECCNIMCWDNKKLKNYIKGKLTNKKNRRNHQEMKHCWV